MPSGGNMGLVVYLNRSFTQTRALIEQHHFLRRIRLECAKNRRRPHRILRYIVASSEIRLQAPAGDISNRRMIFAVEDEIRVMFFRLRIAFWLTSCWRCCRHRRRAAERAGQGRRHRRRDGGDPRGVSDMTGFCGRQPGACDVGAQAATVIRTRAQAGAKMAMTSSASAPRTAAKPDRRRKPEQRSSPQPKLSAAVRTVPPSPGSQSTLKSADPEPA